MLECGQTDKQTNTQTAVTECPIPCQQLYSRRGQLWSCMVLVVLL